MARVLPPLAADEPRQARHVARLLGDLQAVERGLRAGLGFDPPDIADQIDQAAGLLDLDRVARRPARRAPD